MDAPCPAPSPSAPVLADVSLPPARTSRDRSAQGPGCSCSPVWMDAHNFGAVVGKGVVENRAGPWCCHHCRGGAERFKLLQELASNSQYTCHPVEHRPHRPRLPRQRPVRCVASARLCNDQRIALVLSPGCGAASSYLSFAQQLLPRLLYLSYSVIAVQLRLCNSPRTSVCSYARTPISPRTLVRSYACRLISPRTPQLDPPPTRCVQHLESRDWLAWLCAT